jgi:ADP-ribose pyrophosphatase
MNMKKWECKKTELIFEGFFKIKKDTIKLPTNEIREWIYFDSNDSAMVVGMTEDKKLIMIKQYRYLVGNEVIEFPSGGLHDNESIKKAAKREFEEESGFECGSLIRLGSFYETYGQLNRQIHIFFTNNLKKSKQNLDNEKRGFEDIKVELVDFDEAVKLALENKIVAMGSSLAILLLKEKIKKKDNN